MSTPFKYDVFLSFSHEDSDHVRSIYEKIMEHGLSVFWSERRLEKGVAFPLQLEEALIHSQHFALYCTAAAAKSELAGLYEDWEAKQLQLERLSAE